jgi:hypothetical protein
MRDISTILRMTPWPLGWSQRAYAAPMPSTAKPWLQGGGAGWLVIGVLVLAWDVAAPETLSAAFQRARSGPVSGTAVAVAWALLTGHLFDVLPKRADPFGLSIDTVRNALQRGDKRMVPE